MRALAGALAVAALATATEAHAVERTWIGFGAAAQTISPRMLGDAREIVDGVALTRLDGDGRWFVPRVNVALDLDPDAKLGIDLSASWFRDSFVATSSTPIAYSVRRDVFPIAALMRYTPRGPRSVVLAVGPVLALSRFEQSGWLGDGVTFNPAVGGQFRLGMRGSVEEQLRFTSSLFVQWMYLPRENELLADGGGGVAGGFDLAFDVGL